MHEYPTLIRTDIASPPLIDKRYGDLNPLLATLDAASRLDVDVEITTEYRLIPSESTGRPEVVRDFHLLVVPKLDSADARESLANVALQQEAHKTAQASDG